MPPKKPWPKSVIGAGVGRGRAAGHQRDAADRRGAAGDRRAALAQQAAGVGDGRRVERERHLAGDARMRVGLDDDVVQHQVGAAGALRGGGRVACGQQIAAEIGVGGGGEVPREQELLLGDASGGELGEDVVVARAQRLEARVVGDGAADDRGEPRRHVDGRAVGGAQRAGDRDDVAVAAGQPGGRSQVQRLARRIAGERVGVDLGEVRDPRAGGRVEDDRRAGGVEAAGDRGGPGEVGAVERDAEVGDDLGRRRVAALAVQVRRIERRAAVARRDRTGGERQHDAGRRRLAGDQEARHRPRRQARAAL
jgi:hypothetical protein